MKRIIGLIFIISILLLTGTVYAIPPSPGGSGVEIASDCNIAAYYPLGTLCQSSATGKLYKGTGTAVEEITAATAGAGDVTGAAASTDSELPLFSGTGGKTIKRSNTLNGVAFLTDGVVTGKTIGTSAGNVSAGDHTHSGVYLPSTTIDDTKGNGDTAYVWSADKVFDQLALKVNTSAIDDTKGNGDTSYVWSADKTFDQLALKQNALTNPVTGPAVPTAGVLVKWGPSDDTIVDSLALGTMTATKLCTFETATGLTCATDTPSASTYHVDDLISLSGVAQGAVNLGTFTGATIADNQTVKQAFQSLETAFEGLPGGHTQNTDTGTTSPTFAIGSGGPKLKNNSDTMEIRTTADAAYAPLKALTIDGTTITASVGFSGPLTGAVTGAVTGNASSATLASTVTVVDSTDATSYIAMVDSASGSLAVKTDTGITYDATTGMLTATGFTGPLTGNVTGNVSGTAASITGSALPANGTVATSLAFGADPADTGTIRLSNAEYIYSEASPAGTDISVIGVDSGEVVQIGASGASGVTITPDTTITGDLTITGSDLTLGAAGVKMTGDGDGAITFLGLGNGADEDLTFNFDDVSNTVGITSSTGVTTIDFADAMTVEAGAFKSTVTTGTAPFTVASATNVANLNASSLGGATFATPGTIGGGTPAGATFTTIGAGAGGFAVDADGDVNGKSFTIAKVNNVPSQTLLFSSHTTDTTGAGWQGPASIGGMVNSYYLGLPESEPTANQILGAGTPSSHISTMSWIGPMLPLTAGATVPLTGPLVATTPAAGASGYASIRLPHGAAPTTNITNGDCWTTTAGLYCYINGSTVGPYATAGGSPALDDVTNPDAAKTFTLLDNSAAALSLGSSGKASILDIVTTDNGEGVAMSGTLGVTGLITATGGISSGSTLAMGANSITGTGSLGATGAGKFTKLWAIDAETTNLPTVNGTSIHTSPAFTTAITPNSAGASTIGTTALEWGNVYLTDSAVVYGQADQSNSLTSAATGWTANLLFTGSGGFTGTKVNAAGGSATGETLSGTLGIMNGSDTFRGLYLNYTNADHTGTSNTVALIDVPAITGDANSNFYGLRFGNFTGTTGAAGEVEHAINIGTGFDYGLYTSSPVYVSGAIVNGGTNTFNITNGTASLDVAAGAAVNIDTGLTVQTGAVVLTGNAGGSSAITVPNSTVVLPATVIGGTYGATANTVGKRGADASTVAASTIVDDGTNVTLTNTDLIVGGGDIVLPSATAGARITGGNGLITIKGEGDGTDEDLTINLNSSNVATITSSTGVDNIVGLASYSLGAAGVKLTGDGDGAITFLGLGNGSDEDLTINLDDTADTVVISSSTGVTLIDTGAIGTATTGAVSGGSLTPVIDDADNFAANFTGRNLYGGVFIANAAGTVALPAVVAGMNFTIVLEGANAVILNPDSSGTADTIYMNGLAAAQDENITSSTSGAMCVFQYRAANTWMATCNGFAEATPP